MKTISLFLSISLLILSSESQASFEGTLSLDKPLNYKSWFRNKVAPSGSYTVKVKEGWRSLKFKLKNDPSGKHRFKVKVPRYTFPRNGGPITLSSDQTGQSFGIDGNLNVSRNRSEGRERVESCSYKRPVRRCHTDEDGRRVCETRYEEVRGNQRVHYYVLSTEKILTMSLTQSIDMVNLGSLSAREEYRQTIETYRGPCRQWKQVKN